ncbi:MAG: hypothetical protein H6837_13315 [Planctomycetes bacterium]|nr:hypothetical protein [Planctomycetota bacterium]
MQGESFISEKLCDDALNYYRGLASTNARGIRAAALARQGQILFLKASTNNDVGTLRQAQLELARAAIGPDSNPTSSAKALCFTAKVLKALGDNEKNERGAGQDLPAERARPVRHHPVGQPRAQGARRLNAADPSDGGHGTGRAGRPQTFSCGLASAGVSGCPSLAHTSLTLLIPL